MKQVETLLAEQQPEVDRRQRRTASASPASGQNAALAFVHAQATGRARRERESAARAGRARATARLGRSATPSLRARAAADPRARHRHRLHASGSRTAAATATTRWCAARNQLLAMAAPSRCSTACAPTASRTRRSSARHRPRQGERARASPSPTSTRRCRPRSARPTSTTSSIAAACSASSCRPTRRTACSPTTCSTWNVRNSSRRAWCRSRRSPRRAGSPARRSSIRYNGYPAMRITGDAGARLQHRRGDGRDGAAGAAAAAGLRLRVDRPVAARRRSPARRPRLLLALSMLVVFLCLAALYESWSIPFAVHAGGAARRPRRGAGAKLRGLSNDVYFKVGLITIIGLSAKNAILIIEFAKDLRRAGQGADRGDAARPRASALPADPDDLARLHPRRAAAGRSPPAPAPASQRASAPA